MSASVLFSRSVQITGSSVARWFNLFSVCHFCRRSDILRKVGRSESSSSAECPHRISCNNWLSTLMAMQLVSWVQSWSTNPSVLSGLVVVGAMMPSVFWLIVVVVGWSVGCFCLPGFLR